MTGPALDVARVVATWRAQASRLPGGVLVALGFIDRVDAVADAARAAATGPEQLRAIGEALVLAAHVETQRHVHYPAARELTQAMAGLRLIDEAWAATTVDLADLAALGDELEGPP